MQGRKFLDMDRYQWTVLFAAWLGWGFDIFDGLLYALVANNAVPTLLGIPIGGPEAAKAVPLWNGILGSLLLVFWAIGGILFGRITDKFGRTKTLLITMLLYSLGTAACAFAPNIWIFLLFRIAVAFGIGGEWAAGAAMVAEVVPEKRRVEAGAILYTSAPIGLLAANFVSYQLVQNVFPKQPDVSWRYVFACGLLPAVVAFVVRFFIKEPERWEANRERREARIADLFTPQLRRATLGGMAMALVALITWWSCNTFAPTIAVMLARGVATAQSLDKAAAQQLAESYKSLAVTTFCVGGLVGTLLTVPLAKSLGRRQMFGIYFALGALSVIGTFAWPNLEPQTRLWGFLFIGLTVFGVFGSFTYYLPELYPTWLRGTGAGFTYNVGRIIAAIGPFLVGYIAQQGVDAAFKALIVVGFVPIVGLALLPFIVETRGKSLAD